MFLDYSTLEDTLTVNMKTNQFKTKKGKYACVEFYYHMSINGSDKDTLTVYVYRNRNQIQVFQQRGTHPGWNEAQIKIDTPKFFHVRVF